MGGVEGGGFVDAGYAEAAPATEFASAEVQAVGSHG